MWRLDKPDLASAKADIPRYGLAESDNAVLVKLYDQYDAHGGFVTDDEHKSISPETQAVLLSLYDKTYQSGELSDIRSDLFDKVPKCPCCSINAPGELDHYMPKSSYKALSVCRLNLVPMCGDCNRMKSYKPYDGFVHPYYYAGPGVPEFLIATVTVIGNQGLSVELSISPEVKDEQKRRVLENHIEIFHLKTRISHELNVYLCSLFQKPFRSDKALKTSLKHIRKREEEAWGKNDWRTALIRGLIACREFDAEIANSFYHHRKTSVNGGAGL